MTDRNLFHHLPEDAAAAVMAAGMQKTIPKGTVLFSERDHCGEIYIVLDGFAALYRSSFQGENRIIFICSKGEILNEVCLEREKTSVAARALSDMTVLCIPFEEVEKLISLYPVLAQMLFCSLAQKMRRLYHKVGNANGTYALKDRLQALIRKLTRDYGIPTPNGRTVSFEVTVNLLSNMLGAKRETISRALSDLKRSGLITHENGVLTVLDR